jgi:hypothetical protein
MRRHLLQVSQATHSIASSAGGSSSAEPEGGADEAEAAAGWAGSEPAVGSVGDEAEETAEGGGAATAAFLPDDKKGSIIVEPWAFPLHPSAQTGSAATSGERREGVDEKGSLCCKLVTDL